MQIRSYNNLYRPAVYNANTFKQQMDWAEIYERMQNAYLALNPPIETEKPLSEEFFGTEVETKDPEQGEREKIRLQFMDLEARQKEEQRLSSQPQRPKAVPSSKTVLEGGHVIDIKI